MSFTDGQLVLGKVPSYSKWPAVVVPEDKIPADVKKVKNNKSHCVFFFGNDPSFFWGDSKSIFPLDISTCESQAKKAKGLIKKAYQHALEYKDNFLGVLEPQEGYDETSIEDLDANHEEGKDDDEEIKKELAEDSAYDDEEEEEKIKKPKKKTTPLPKKESKKATTTTSTKRRSQASTSLSEEEPHTKKATPLQTKKKQPSPPAHLSWNDDEKYKHFWFIRTKLQKGLISRTDPPTTDEMQTYSSVLSKLESLSADNIVDLNVLKTTKLHKVLKAIIKLEKLERADDFKFHQRSAKLLDQWSPLILAIKGDRLGREVTPLEKDKVGVTIKLGSETDLKEKTGVTAQENGDKIHESFTLKREETAV